MTARSQLPADLQVGLGVRVRVRSQVGDRTKDRGRIMLDDGDLSDSERRRLAEIESSLTTEDPAFVHRFAERQLRRRRKQHNVAIAENLVRAGHSRFAGDAAILL